MTGMQQFNRHRLICIVLLGFFFYGSTDFANADDMRQAQMAVKAQKEALLKAVAQEKQAAETEAAQSRERILSDRSALVSAVNALKARASLLKKENAELESRLDGILEEEKQLNETLSQTDTILGELTGVIRISARDLNALMAQNLQTAFAPQNIQRLEAISDQSEYPAMKDIEELVSMYFSEIRRSGEVRIENGLFTGPSGEAVSGDILVLGNFTAAYRRNGDMGFLDYIPENQRLQALLKSPGRRIKNKLAAYMSGKADDVPIDVSKGGALRQMAHGTSLMDKIPQGGPIVWPILGILAAAVLIAMERVIFLAKKKMNTQGFMNSIYELSMAGKWEECGKLCKAQPDKPLAKVVLAGINFRHMQREDMENAVQETILREIPPLEKYLSTMGMLAAIAPLLGLLGTVTGMINTFHMITFYGTGDPRMMSGGISEALVTTMLGLMVAIPIMFAHTLLSRKVETTIGELEEKAVSFINMVYKTQKTS